MNSAMGALDMRSSYHLMRRTALLGQQVGASLFSILWVGENLPAVERLLCSVEVCWLRSQEEVEVVQFLVRVLLLALLVP